MNLTFTRARNDLYSEDVFCSCMNPKYPDLKLETRFQLTGYNDGYFFDTVNGHPNAGSCPTCGRKYWYQWFRSCILFAWLE